ncbi:hypothetical protein [Clostridium sp. Marseille-P299]|uniref:hypothetical protein n=1 Tax=Clostridium sp. Marseille-P299 TaxID=1805477 RepID=UPI000A4D34AD|nr:hypothetical protein [Clostridium sp. Marseille-P299]
MSVKIKVSYETEQELKTILSLLDPVVKKWSKQQKQGRYNRVYIKATIKKEQNNDERSI